MKKKLSIYNSSNSGLPLRGLGAGGGGAGVFCRGNLFNSSHAALISMNLAWASSRLSWFLSGCICNLRRLHAWRMSSAVASLVRLSWDNALLSPVTSNVCLNCSMNACQPRSRRASHSVQKAARTSRAASDFQIFFTTCIRLRVSFSIVTVTWTENNKEPTCQHNNKQTNQKNTTNQNLTNKRTFSNIARAPIDRKRPATRATSNVRLQVRQRPADDLGLMDAGCQLMSRLANIPPVREHMKKEEESRTHAAGTPNRLPKTMGRRGIR